MGKHELMIYDYIKNFGLYKGLTPTINLPLDYMVRVTPDMEISIHPQDLGIKTVVRF